MNEDLADVLMRAADALRWFEKYNESNALILLARLIRAAGVTTRGELEAYVKAVEATAFALREKVEASTPVRIGPPPYGPPPSHMSDWSPKKPMPSGSR